MQLLQVNENFLDQVMNYDQSSGKGLLNTFVNQFDILEMAYNTQEEATGLEQVKSLVIHVWSQLVMLDEQKIKEV